MAMFSQFKFSIDIPIGSMYGIFTYIWLIFMANVGIYTIHGWYGNWYQISKSAIYRLQELGICTFPFFFQEATNISLQMVNCASANVGFPESNSQTCTREMVNAEICPVKRFWTIQRYQSGNYILHHYKIQDKTKAKKRLDPNIFRFLKSFRSQFEETT